jgi:hypothetical protein
MLCHAEQSATNTDARANGNIDAMDRLVHEISLP